jgi:hypothetical protein
MPPICSRASGADPVGSDPGFPPGGSDLAPNAVGIPEQSADREPRNAGKSPHSFHPHRTGEARIGGSIHLQLFDEKGLAISTGTFHHSRPFGCPPNSQRTAIFDADALQRASRGRPLRSRDVRQSHDVRHDVRQGGTTRAQDGPRSIRGRGVAARKLVKPEHSGRYPTLMVGIAPGNRGVL